MAPAAGSGGAAEPTVARGWCRWPEVEVSVALGHE